MRVSLLTIGEPLPMDGHNIRLHRAGMFAEFLASKGHQVVWWSSTFDHVNKKNRFARDTTINVSDRYRIRLLHSVAYKKNVSLRRILNHRGVAGKFARLAETEPPPDIILSSLPTLELCLSAAKYGREKKVPVILDVRDLWPDIFLDLVPLPLRKAARVALFPMFETLKAACAGATAITGLTPGFVDWGVKHANRRRTSLDRDFPMGYSDAAPGAAAVREAENFWAAKGLPGGSDKKFIACFFGTLGRQFDLETIIEAAKKLSGRERPFHFVLCGSGDNFDYYRKLAGGCDNITFPGWVNAEQIWVLMRMSAVGLAPYLSTRNFTINLPNKPVEYLSAGLPVVSSLSGVLEELLCSSNCGVTYPNHSPDALAAALIDLYDDPGWLGEMSKNAHALYLEKFVAGKVYTDIMDHLELVCESYRNEHA
ncbi:MAG: Alpha-D-kanosaminyltransferase [Pelotomaculum sp. PtaU1.Bin065]|nr:MAG: Alpha-D-kanosaminyltransferase [Pelotomaculum sp. PtaU1.Bin065]